MGQIYSMGGMENSSFFSKTFMASSLEKWRFSRDVSIRKRKHLSVGKYHIILKGLRE